MHNQILIEADSLDPGTVLWPKEISLIIPWKEQPWLQSVFSKHLSEWLKKTQNTKKPELQS